MLEIWFMRHGETEWNSSQRWQGHTDLRLNDVGKSQARRLGGRLRAHSFKGAWTSDLMRCRETARLALPAVEATPDPRLRELCFGIFEGKCNADMTADERAALEDWWTDPYGRRIPDGESLRDLEERVTAWRAELPGDGRYAVFTHGGAIRTVLYALTGPPERRQWWVQLDNCGITRIRYGSSPMIVCVNDCGHLEAAETGAAHHLSGGHRA